MDMASHQEQSSGGESAKVDDQDFSNQSSAHPNRGVHDRTDFSPVFPNVSEPFISTNLFNTNQYAYMVACYVLSEWKAGRKVVIDLNGQVRGAGKTAIVAAILGHLSNMKEVKDAGTVSFIAVKQHTMEIDGKTFKCVHIDPDYKGHKNFCSLHDQDWDVLFWEHGYHYAFAPYKRLIKKLKDKVVHCSIEIKQEKEHRVFTMTTATGAPILTPTPFSWEGRLLEERRSLDSRLTRKQARALMQKYGKDVVIMSIETSCDDTCVVVMCGGRVIYSFKKLCEQQDQLEGKQGVDPWKTAQKHKNNLDYAEKEVLEELKKLDIKLDLVSVTQGPGQAFSLLEGIAFAQKMAVGFGCPIMYMDHIMGHAISSLLTERPPQYPYITFVISGGHTVLLLVKSPVDMQIIYTVPNDAVGEVIDKISRALGIRCVPAGPEAERFMKAYRVPQELWIKITSKTTDDQIKATPEKFHDELTRFRNTLRLFDNCPTLSDIKALFCRLIRDQKLRECNKKKLLATFVKEFVHAESLTKDKFLAMTSLFSGHWCLEDDGTYEVFKQHLEDFQVDEEFSLLVRRCHLLSLRTTLDKLVEKIQEDQEQIHSPQAFLRAFLQHFEKLDFVNEEDVVYLCQAFNEAQRPQLVPKELLEFVRDTAVGKSMVRTMEQIVLHRIPFDIFMREFEDITALPLLDQQFFCACKHSVLLRFMNTQLAEGVTKFPDVKEISIGGGVACSEFFSGELKKLWEEKGFRFTKVPRDYCADNAHMIWKLTHETLGYLFSQVEACACGEEGQTHCRTCDELTNSLFQHGCGMMHAVVEKGDIAHAAGDDWRHNPASAHKFFSEVPTVAPIAMLSGEFEPDAEVTPPIMLEAMKSKSTSAGGCIDKVRQGDKRWKEQKCRYASWIEENKEQYEGKFTNKLKRETLKIILSTNFFGHGYQALKDEAEKDAKNRKILDDCEAFFSMLPKDFFTRQ